MPSVTRKSHADRAARRAEILTRLLEAVERLLERGAGYTELSVERIVAEAGIARSTFYVYFEDKGALLEALAEDVVSTLTQAAAAWWSLPPGAPRADVAAGIGTVIDAYRPHGSLMGAVVEAATYDERVGKRFAELVADVTGELAGHIANGQDAGTIDRSIDAVATAEWLVWMTERGLYQLVRGASDKRVAALHEALTTIVWKTLYEEKA